MGLVPNDCRRERRSYNSPSPASHSPKVPDAEKDSRQGREHSGLLPADLPAEPQAPQAAQQRTPLRALAEGPPRREGSAGTSAAGPVESEERASGQAKETRKAPARSTGRGGPGRYKGAG